MKKILIVDDDPHILDVVRTILELNGFAVFTHNSGIGAGDQVKKTNPDLILLDVRLPGKSGIEICKELKAMSHLPPIILFSANSLKDVVFATCQRMHLFTNLSK